MSSGIEPLPGSEPGTPVLGKEKRLIGGELAFLILCGLCFGALFFQGTFAVLNWLSAVVNKTPLTVNQALVVSQIGSGVLGVLIGAGVGNLAWDWVTRSRRLWDKTPVGGKVTVIVAVFVGLTASVPFMFFLYTLLNANYPALVGAMIALMLGFTTLSVYVLQSIADVLPWNQGSVKGRRSGIKLLDTNILIDGRIHDVVKSGFLEGPFYVPNFVLEELQHIADSADALRRQRGRRGLEVLRLMQNEFPIEIGIHDKLAGAAKEDVDQRLIRLARALGADIVTNDWNLNRVAQVQEIRVLNLNELALSLRPNVLPTEGMTILVVREGNQPLQGVGYLEDGTMVVVDGGKRFIGQTIEVRVTQVIQTERGKMIFATPMDDELPPSEDDRNGYR